MDILLKLLGFALCAVMLILFVNQYRKEFALSISLCAGAVFFYFIAVQAGGIFKKVRALSETVGVDILYIEILFKIIGIAYICEFASAVCRDCGQNAFGVKIDLAGKLMILSASLPVFGELIGIITKILP